MKKKQLTISEMARMGGHARAKTLTKKRRSEIARKASRTAKRLGKLTGRPKKTSNKEGK